MTDIVKLIEGNRTFYDSEKTFDISYRRQALENLAASLKKYESDIEKALHEDLGKSPLESYMCETGQILFELRYILKHLNELGYLSLDQKSSNLLFQVLAQRYEVRSTIVTSNLEFSKWPDFIGDPLLANALVDRLVHRSAVLNMNGEGYRLRDRRPS